MNNLKVTRKNIYLIAGFALMFFIFTNLNVFAADKIGFVNLREIMQNSNSGKKAGEELKKFYAKKSETIKATENELKKLKDDLEKQGSILTEAARKDREITLQKKMRDYQILVDDTNKELQVKDKEIFDSLTPDIAKAIRAVAEREKYTLVIDLAIVPVAYHAEENNLSKKVIDEYNKQRQNPPSKKK
ncbi:MAG: OmpH family outer membrane protein [Smithellaceae bacterium]